VPHTSRYIFDPVYREQIDVGHLLPIIDSRHFQALADKRQLGMSFIDFRDAHHTRFQHSLGAYRATRTLMHKWLVQGLISAEEHNAVPVYALLHDVGHPAFSHVTEDFCELDDDERSLELIEGELREAIASCGIDPDLVAALARHANPLYLAVHDKTLGMEKLDYLERDGHHTGLDCPSAVRTVRKYVTFREGAIAVDEKMTDSVLGIMDFYVKMYKEVYLRKSLVITQRMFQKGVYHLIIAGELDPKDIYDLTDSELWGGLMYRSKDPVVQEMYQRIRGRRLFCEAVVLRAAETSCETRIAGKSIAVRPVSPLTMQMLIDSPRLGKQNHAALEDLEQAIEGAVKLPVGSVLVVPVFNPERFRAQDVMLLGDNECLHSLKGRRPAHFEKMWETGRAYTAFRVCAPPEHREALSRAAAEVEDVVVSFVK
jgi:HD superfamily phosphohydrolase